MSRASNEPLLAVLGAFAASLRWDGIPESARAAARVQILDVVAAAHAGALSGEASRFFESFPAGSGPSTAITTGRRHGPAEAAFVNAAHSMSQDYDDIMWMGHTGHSAVFSSLAVAEAEKKTSREVVTAVVVANEIAGRIGASSVLGPLNGQMWTFIHSAGAAAATSSLLGLEARAMTHALAIALSQPTYALQPAFFGPTSKLLAASIPTQIGVQAAYLARAGMTGAANLLEDRRGFWSVFSFRPLPEMLGGLRDTWLIETLSIKASPACHYFQTACEAAAELAGRKSLRPEEVASITVATTKLGEEVSRFAAEYASSRPELTPIGASFDLALAVAISLHAGRFTAAESSTEWLGEHADVLRAWYAKIRVEHDPELTMRVLDGARAIPAGRAALAQLGVADWAHVIRSYRDHYGSKLLRPREATGWARALARRLRRRDGDGPHAGRIPLFFPNRVTVVMRNGERESSSIELPCGSLAGPRALGTLHEKFAAAVAPRLGERAAERAFAVGLELETAELADFVRLVTPAAELA